MSRALVACLLCLPGILLAGCATDGPSAHGVSTLERHLSLRPTADSFSPTLGLEEAIGQASDASFSFNYAGSGLDTAQAIVHYQSTAGVDRSAPLSTFTPKARLAAGDVVAISPPDMGVLSSVRVESGDEVLASRGLTEVGWFTAGGMPLPLASTLTGAARWTLHASGGMDASLDGLNFTNPGEEVCDSSGCHNVTITTQVETLTLKYEQATDGTAAIVTEAGPPTRVRLDVADLVTNLTVDLAAHGHAGTQALDVSLAGRCLVHSSLLVNAVFDAAHEITSMGVSGSMKLEGDLATTGLGEDDGPACQDEQAIPAMQRPMALPKNQDAVLLAFLRKMWSLDLGVGDEYRFQSDSPEGTIDYTSQVLAQEARTVGGAARPTFKVFDSLTIKVPNLDDLRYDVTSWVDAATYLPVYSQATFTRTFSAAEFAPVVGLLAEGLQEEGGSLGQPPTGVTLTLRTDSTSELTSYSGDLTEAAVAALGAGRMVPFLAAGIFGDSLEQAGPPG